MPAIAGVRLVYTTRIGNVKVFASIASGSARLLPELPRMNVFKGRRNVFDFANVACGNGPSMSWREGVQRRIAVRKNCKYSETRFRLVSYLFASVIPARRQHVTF